MPAAARTSTRPCGFRSASLTTRAGRATSSSSPTACRPWARRTKRRGRELEGVEQGPARIFCFGVGYDLNARFLDKLVRENFGLSEYVRPDENIEEHVGRLIIASNRPY